MNPQTHSLIIIGSGPAGLTAGIYAGRAQLAPLIIEGPQPGGQLMGTTLVENWPGASKIMGPQLMLDMRAQAESCGASFLSETVTSVDLTTSPYTIITAQRTLTTRALIIATGAAPRKLQCPGEATYWGKGVSTCAVCDGALYRNNDIIVVGGGDTAMEDASFLAKLGNRVTIIHIRGQLSASAPMQRRVLENPLISIRFESQVVEILGDGKRVTGVTVVSQKSGESQTLPAQAIFIAIGQIPNTSLFTKNLPLKPSGHIITKENSTETEVPGVFAAGDVVDARYRQAITSAGEGCRAALDAERYLQHHS